MRSPIQEDTANSIHNMSRVASLLVACAVPLSAAAFVPSMTMGRSATRTPPIVMREPKKVAVGVIGTGLVGGERRGRRRPAHRGLLAARAAQDRHIPVGCARVDEAILRVVVRVEPGRSPTAQVRGERRGPGADAQRAQAARAPAAPRVRCSC